MTADFEITEIFCVIDEFNKNFDKKCPIMPCSFLLQTCYMKLLVENRDAR